MQTTTTKTSRKAPKTATPGEVIQKTLTDARKAIAKAEGKIEKRVKGLLKQRPAKDAQAMLGDVRDRFDDERARVERELDRRMRDIQKRIDEERKSLGKRADDAVRTTLGALNIPTRQEVTALTRRVEELSRRIDALKVRQRRAAAHAA